VNGAQLREEIQIELENMELVVREVASLRSDLTGREPTVREKTAAAGFLVQFYNGVENILKRISRYHSVALPVGENWHVDLFKRFCTPAATPLPALFDEKLAAGLAPFRKFRHVVYHGYGFQLDWARMSEGLGQLEGLFAQFKNRLEGYLKTIESQKSGG